MKYIIGKHTLLGLLAAAFVLLTGCQSDGGDTVDTPRQQPTMEMQAYARTYNDAMPIASTRAGETWTPPSGFTLYTGHEDIKVAFTQGSSIAKGFESTKDAAGSFVFVPGVEPAIPDKWMSTFVLPTNGSYYLYGYMPDEGNLSLAPINSNYANGAAMTITGLPTATSSDVCVIVGVSKGSSPTVDGGIIMGQFDYSISDATNHVFLLCDHLYAALCLNIRVNKTYHALRHITLKKVWVKDCKNGDTPLTSKSRVNLTLEKTDNDILDPSKWVSPIKSISFRPDESTTMSDMEQTPLFESTEGLELNTGYQEVQGYMAPIGMTDFTLVSQYDVYDTNGNLIRENQTAENKINISSLFRATTSLTKGTRYTLKLTVNPTYLYMMSEPDLENPMPVVNGGS